MSYKGSIIQFLASPRIVDYDIAICLAYSYNTGSYSYKLYPSNLIFLLCLHIQISKSLFLDDADDFLIRHRTCTCR